MHNGACRPVIVCVFCVAISWLPSAEAAAQSQPPVAGPAAENAVRAAGGEWLDATPVARWNTQGAAIPKPPTAEGEPLAAGRCASQTRPPDTPGDRALATAGWQLVGPLQVFGEVSLATAAVAADGMCRPLGLQAFVFVRGRFAGTLSPHPMNSRTDGVVTDLRLLSRDRIMVSYARYAGEDALCCPSRTSTAAFGITRSPGGSVLTLESVTTPPADER